ncbi:MAG: 30S ribosomal protein S12 methylthiotransferase RimO, partial [Planctomycetaceae bacterium]
MIGLPILGDDALATDGASPKDDHDSVGLLTRGTFSMVSLGCPKNLVDSERMLGLLAADGWRMVREPRGSDLVIVNTCAFLDASRRESYET